MCRMLGYLGDAVALRALLDDPPHSLEKQSYRAREMQGATVNADGWGAAWYLDDDLEACVYRCTSPIWGDVNRTHLGRAVRSRCVLAAVRSATDPLGLSHANTQPFSAGALSFVHNGYVRDFDRAVARKLRDSLSDEQYARLRGHTDSEHVFAAFVDEYARLDAPPPERLAQALVRALDRVRLLSREAGVVALLTVIVSDGRALVGARVAEGGDAPTLYLRHGSATWLASEPLDDDSAWTKLSPGRLVIATPGALPTEQELS